MNRATLLLLLLWAFNANAQNWAPLSRTEKFNYTDSAGQLVTRTVWIDSAAVIGSDSVFYLNRVVQYCDSCGYAVLHRPQFLQKQAVVSANGVWNFKQPGNFTLNTSAALNDTAFFDSINNISGVVSTIQTTALFGFTDSVKSIVLSSGDLILLSKNYGLLKFPKGYSNNQYYDITGIQEGRNLGVQVPMLKDIYNFQVGDVFLYHEFVAAFLDYSYDTWTRDSIASKSIAGDSISYLMYFNSTNYITPPSPGQYNTSSGTTTLKVLDTTISVLNSYPNQELYGTQLYTPSAGLEYVFDQILTCIDTIPVLAQVLIYNDSSGRFIKQIGPVLYYCHVCIDTIETLPTFPIPLYEIYQKGLGLINGRVAWCSSPGGGQFQLVGARAVADTFGSVYLAGIDTPKVADTTITVDTTITIDTTITVDTIITVANVVHNIINVQVSSTIALQMQLYDLAGKVLYENRLSGTNFEIPSGEIAKGMYILKCIVGQLHRQFKILKL